MKARERFLAACQCQPADRPPVWLMRQAGRYLPEYRAIREQHDFMQMCNTPELVVEVSLQPWRRFGMDAVIVFADILLIAAAMGPQLSFAKGHGPVFDRAIRGEQDVDSLARPEVEDALAPTLKSLSILRRELGDEAALLGFCGAPWTVAAYLVEGKGGSFSSLLEMKTKAPDLLKKLLAKITSASVDYVRAQAQRGVDAIQIFDTWGGLLTPSEYEEFSLPGMKSLVAAVQSSGAKPIVFIKDTQNFLPQLVQMGSSVVALGPDLPLAQAKEAFPGVALQGNLSPDILLQGPEATAQATQAMLNEMQDRFGYIVNLGHGVTPQVEPSAVEAMVDTVKRFCYPA
ncbi:MAG: uroporphyrinogen decarboxylase [Deltaproteobacteria bacterium CG_4_10_14_0_2_um_filter_43_8]|nr:MAG: uroporphyrinogen decarboxylase [Deltaproteobacteria bacterium CG_4_10_14_0_2_um_filter_43_8]PJC64764.1 MAG: uroporphyrinogen decarboxylase [Deltaproteobacteria bacterium CG_4_9_14_0_2_um_filter_42_21]